MSEYRGAVAVIPPLPATAILLVEVGSTAHGTGLPGGEDHDELAVVVEGPAEVLGLAEGGLRSQMHRTQPEGARSGPGTLTARCTCCAGSCGWPPRAIRRY
jgi:hypothetical protein